MRRARAHRVQRPQVHIVRRTQAHLPRSLQCNVHHGRLAAHIGVVARVEAHGREVGAHGVCGGGQRLLHVIKTIYSFLIRILVS